MDNCINGYIAVRPYLLALSADPLWVFYGTRGKDWKPGVCFQVIERELLLYSSQYSGIIC
jgi:hypothetical protein